jgi:hypothetical protein
MSLLDILRQEYVRGRVIDKYRMRNGNIGLVIEDERARKRYNVEFKDRYEGPCIENLFGLLNDPFSDKTEHVDKLVKNGDKIELALSYSKGPFMDAYMIYSVSHPNDRQSPYERIQNVTGLPYARNRAVKYS